MTAWRARADIGDAELAPAARPSAIDLDTQLLLANLVARLQRVVTEAGSGHRAFLRDIRGVHPARLSEKQRAHIMRVAWRYRFQLPPLLRPACDPDKAIQQEPTHA